MQDQPIEVDFEDAYRQAPPWEIGRPQPTIVRLLDEAAIESPVLDVGCGSGENTIEMAKRGLSVIGVDASALAIALAREKAERASVDVEFTVGEAHGLNKLGSRFRTVVDSALLHIIDRRAEYSDQLARVTESNGRVILLEISDRAEIPYPKISKEEILRTFPETKWRVLRLAESSYVTNLGVFPAWLTILTLTSDRDDGITSGLV